MTEPDVCRFCGCPPTRTICNFGNSSSISYHCYYVECQKKREKEIEERDNLAAIDIWNTLNKPLT